MPYEFIPVVIGVVFILGLGALGLLRSYLVTRNRIRLREMMHQERLKAIEKETPLSDLTYDDNLDSELAAIHPRSNPKTMLWLRLTALCVGLSVALGGLGMMVAFIASWDHELRKIWSIGLIPFMVGVGLLLFYYLTRAVAKEVE